MCTYFPQYLPLPGRPSGIPFPSTSGATPATNCASQPNAIASSSKPIIDPSLLDIPDDDDEPLDVKAKLQRRHAPANKIAGSRRSSVADPKGKGKARVVDAPSKGVKRKAPQSKDREVKKPRGGRTPGVANYSSDDVDALFEIMEEVLPIGGKGWGNVEDEFLSWAAVNGRPARTAKSLETKFKQVSCHI